MSPLCAAGIRSGIAGASAFKAVSTTVGNMTLHCPMAANGRALRKVPSGNTSCSARKEPSFTGAPGRVRHL